MKYIPAGIHGHMKILKNNILLILILLGLLLCNVVWASTWTINLGRPDTTKLKVNDNAALHGLIEKNEKLFDIVAYKKDSFEDVYIANRELFSDDNTSSSEDPLEKLTPELCLERSVRIGANGELLTGLWYVGVVLSMAASVSTNLGVNVQKYSLMKEIRRVKNAEAEELFERSYVKQPLWLFGLVLVILGSVGDFAALGFAAQSLCTTVGGFTIVVNVFFGHYFLKEHLSRFDLVATFLVMVGIVVVAISGDKTEKEFSFECLLLLYTRMIFIIYIVIVVLLSIVLLAATKHMAHLREFHMQEKRYQYFKQIHPILPAALSGILGSQSVLFAKCTAEILRIAFTTNEGAKVARRWETYIIVGCMLFTIFNQLHWLAHSLRFFDAVLIVPIFQCFFILGGVVGGAVFFDEFGGLSRQQIGVFAGGLIVTMIGVYMLSRRKHDDEQAPAEAEDEAQAILKYRASIKLSPSMMGYVHESVSESGANPNVMNPTGALPSVISQPSVRRQRASTHHFPFPGDEVAPEVANRQASYDSYTANAPLSLQIGQLAVTDLLYGLYEEFSHAAAPDHGPGHNRRTIRSGSAESRGAVLSANGSDHDHHPDMEAARGHNGTARRHSSFRDSLGSSFRKFFTRRSSMKTTPRNSRHMYEVQNNNGNTTIMSPGSALSPFPSFPANAAPVITDVRHEDFGRVIPFPATPPTFTPGPDHDDATENDQLQAYPSNPDRANTDAAHIVSQDETQIQQEQDRRRRNISKKKSPITKAPDGTDESLPSF